MFALKHKETGEFAGFRYSSNGDAEFSTSIEFTLKKGKYTNNMWVVKDRRIAENAANNTSEWYNADFETPVNEWAGEWEVVELTKYNNEVL